MTPMESGIVTLLESRLLVVQQELRPRLEQGVGKGDETLHAITMDCFRLLKLLKGEGNENDVQWLLNGRRDGA